eukprot:GEZU01014373.1.p1 GENE.GEZU01014373.1~~GEZU01014373.1.p1  ORF type:complete len:777 (+),score=276.53 GEZU01014373.1:25-2355(+)
MAAAQGVVHATERLFQMDFYRRIGAGTLSQAFGEKFLEWDKFYRTLGFRRQAEREFQNMDASMRSLLEAYANGANSVNRNKPFEANILGDYNIQPWTAIDCLVVNKLFQWSMSNNYRKELLRYKLLVDRKLAPERIHELIPPYPESKDTVTFTLDDMNYPMEEVPANIALEDNGILFENAYLKSLNIQRNETDFEAEEAVEDDNKPSLFEVMAQWDPAYDYFGLEPSNYAFMAAGISTFSESPIMGSGLQSRFHAPGMWYLMSLQFGNTTDTASFDLGDTNSTNYKGAVGVTFPGIPGILQGRTSKYGWTISSSMADNQDIYIETENEDKTKYLLNGQYVDYITREEQIYIKGRADPITIKVRSTVHGPILNDVIKVPGDRPLALKWSGFDYDTDTSFYGFWKLLQVDSFESFAESARYILNPPINFMYGNTSKGAGYVHAGLVPKRNLAAGHTGMFPTESSNLEKEWTYISEPIQKILPVFSVEYVINANNKVFQKGYKHLLGFDYAPHYRYVRIKQLLDNVIFNESRTITQEVVEKMQADHINTFFLELKPIITGLGMDSKAAKDLAEWDGDSYLGSNEAFIFESYVWELARLPIDETGIVWYNPLYISNVLKYNNDSACSGHGSCHEYAKTALDQAVDKFGRGNNWGTSTHKAKHVHPVLDTRTWGCVCSRSTSAAGTAYTIMASVTDGTEGGSFTAREGTTYRQIVDCTSDEYLRRNSEFMTVLGNGGNPFAFPQYDHWNDRYMKMKGGVYSYLGMDLDAPRVIATQTVDTK